jgi:hypothetical protein
VRWQDFAFSAGSETCLWELFHENSKLERSAHGLTESEVQEYLMNLPECLGFEGYPFTQEFKREAVKLVAENGHPTAQVARELGLTPNLLRRWKQRSPVIPSPLSPARDGANLMKRSLPDSSGTWPACRRSGSPWPCRLRATMPGPLARRVAGQRQIGGRDRLRPFQPFNRRRP